jgi:hypothetical protein
MSSINQQTKLELYFGSSETPGLYRTVFHAPRSSKPIVGMRGTTLHTTALPFIWGPAAQSLSLLFVSAVQARVQGNPITMPLLEGGSASPAGALARLLKKRTTSWLHDLFGTDASGRSLLHRIVILGNARGKQHGPTTATLREEYLSSSDLRVFIDGEDISSNEPELARLRAQLMDSYIPRRNPLEGETKQILSNVGVWAVSEKTSS